MQFGSEKRPAACCAGVGTVSRSAHDGGLLCLDEGRRIGGSLRITPLCILYEISTIMAAQWQSRVTWPLSSCGYRPPWPGVQKNTAPGSGQSAATQALQLTSARQQPGQTSHSGESTQVCGGGGMAGFGVAGVMGGGAPHVPSQRDVVNWKALGWTPGADELRHGLMPPGSRLQVFPGGRFPGWYPGAVEQPKCALACQCARTAEPWLWAWDHCDK